MLFNSAVFAAFLPVVLTVYWLLPRRFRIWFLVVASYVFYGSWDYRFLSLIMISTGVDYAIGLALGRTDIESRRRALLISSLTVNLGILWFFKYAGFFVDSAARLLNSIGFDVSSPMLSIALPVGISFYTFQTISYTFDVYRRRIEPEKSLVVFAAYVAYFPQLVAGPIERARKLLPQLKGDAPPPGLVQIRSAVALIATGLFKKVVLADGLAHIVNERFSQPEDFSSLSLAIGVYAFAIQIYGDFSGYSSIARGVSRLFGIELMRNFEQPYLSTNITQFWRTWHISLSSWLHDYLYVPLGGNRGSQWHTYRNLMITMLLGGLWHGASWTFVFWGALHGVYLSINRAFGTYEPRGQPGMPKAQDIWRIVLTFQLVCFAWIFFRAGSMSDAFGMVEGIFDFSGTEVEGLVLQQVTVAALMMLGLDLVDRGRNVLKPLRRLHPVVLGAGLGFIVISLLVFGGGTPVPFIYFQF